MNKKWLLIVIGVPFPLIFAIQLGDIILQNTLNNEIQYQYQTNVSQIAGMNITGAPGAGIVISGGSGMTVGSKASTDSNVATAQGTIAANNRAPVKYHEKLLIGGQKAWGDSIQFKLKKGSSNQWHLATINKPGVYSITQDSAGRLALTPSK